MGFKRHLRAEVVADDAVYVFSERRVVAMQGERIELIAPMLDGTRDLETLLRDTSAAGVSREQVVRVVRRLEDQGLVGSWYPPDPMDETSCAYWDSSGLDPQIVMNRLTSPIALLAVGGGIDRHAARRAFENAGLTIRDNEDDAEFSVVLCDDYLSPRLGEIDADHRQAKRPWLLARPLGERVWIGPIFTTDVHAGPCWHCLADRLRLHRPAERHVQAFLGRTRSVPRPAATLPPLAAAAFNLTALETMKWLAGQRHEGQRCVWTFDSADLEGRRHEVRARPQCHSCGDPTLMRQQAGQPVVLESRAKRGGTPEETLARYRHLVSPISGVVKEIRRANGTPEMFNVFKSGATSLPGARSLRGLRAALAMQNAGKGMTPAQAETGALCEALERHCATFAGDEEMVEASYAGLGEQAIHPDSCQLYHPRQFEGRWRWNASHDTPQFVCDPFDDHATMSWSPVWSHTHQRLRFLPTGVLYFGAPRKPGPMMVCADSNGNAAGASLEHAVWQGLLEIVERDAVAIWWYNRIRRPALDLPAFGDPWVDELREAYRRIGREVWALDLTVDLGVPVIAAVSRRVDQSREEIVFGFGAHRDVRVALRRGFAELNQLCSASFEARSAGRQMAAGIDAENWWRSATLETQPYLVPDPAEPPRSPAVYPLPHCDDIRDDIRHDIEMVHQRLRRAGLEMLVLNHTRPDIGLAAVKVIVPGMRHFWARFAPGRLYDVPVQMGQRAQPIEFDELNPIPLFV
ncbi:MAG TPA: TOMM precursor leader peptide-binding protein [Candidatus Limnocylindrales bacterium]|nr:TOMM precursor leader peptide-binding protein [Candidatus Limnocylindrales bacterium]